MLKVDAYRVTDPEAFSSTEILEACDKHGQLVVQFSRPEAYSAPILSSLNEACRLAQDRLQVRFYGHYGTRFDAFLLRHLVGVRLVANILTSSMGGVFVTALKLFTELRVDARGT